MADKTWANFLDYTLPYIVDAPRPLVEKYIQLTVQDFLENTLALRSTFDTITLVASTAEYNLTFASQGIGASGQYEPVSVVSNSVVDSSNNPFYETTEEELEQKVWNWRTLTNNTRPTHFYLTWDHKLYFHPYPGSGYAGSYTVTGECYIKPSESALGVLDTVWNNYKEYIGYGTAERMLRMPGQRWSNLGAAEYFSTQYRRGAAKVKAEIIRGKTRRSGAVRPPDTFLLA